MARVEVFGALCGASVNYSGVRGSGASALQGVELAGYLAGLGPAETALAMAKYMRDGAALNTLLILVNNITSDMCFSEGWVGFPAGRRSAMLEIMASLSVAEVVSPAVCKRCHGVGFVGARSCHACSGTGRVALSDRAVSESMQLPWTTFKRNWRERYGRVLAKVQSFDAEVNRAVSRQICADMEIYF